VLGIDAGLGLLHRSPWFRLSSLVSPPDPRLWVIVMFVSDIGAVAAETSAASAARCRAVLAAIGRLRSWLDERETAWLDRLADHDPAYDWADDAEFPLAG